MRWIKLLSLWLTICLALPACTTEKEEIPSAQGQVDKAKAAADAANRVTARTNDISAATDGEESGDEEDGEEP